MSASPGADVRRRLNHPVIDADGHWAELNPIFFEYIREVAGLDALERFRKGYGERARPWYRATPEERRWRRMTRPPFWGMPTNTRDRAAAMIPALFYESLDDWGIDLAITYPSMGLGLSREVREPDLVHGIFRAYNTMVA